MVEFNDHNLDLAFKNFDFGDDHGKIFDHLTMVNLNFGHGKYQMVIVNIFPII